MPEANELETAFRGNDHGFPCPYNFVGETDVRDGRSQPSWPRVGACRMTEPCGSGFAGTVRSREFRAATSSASRDRRLPIWKFTGCGCDSRSSPRRDRRRDICFRQRDCARRRGPRRSGNRRPYTTTINIKGESYRLKAKRKAGVLNAPVKEEEGKAATG